MDPLFDVNKIDIGTASLSAHRKRLVLSFYKAMQGPAILEIERFLEFLSLRLLVSGSFVDLNYRDPLFENWSDLVFLHGHTIGSEREDDGSFFKSRLIHVFARVARPSMNGTLPKGKALTLEDWTDRVTLLRTWMTLQLPPHPLYRSLGLQFALYALVFSGPDDPLVFQDYYDVVAMLFNDIPESELFARMVYETFLCFPDRDEFIYTRLKRLQPIWLNMSSKEALLSSVYLFSISGYSEWLWLHLLSPSFEKHPALKQVDPQPWAITVLCQSRFLMYRGYDKVDFWTYGQPLLAYMNPEFSSRTRMTLSGYVRRWTLCVKHELESESAPLLMDVTHPLLQLLLHPSLQLVSNHPPPSKDNVLVAQLPGAWRYTYGGDKDGSFEGSDVKHAYALLVLLPSLAPASLKLDHEFQGEGEGEGDATPLSFWPDASKHPLQYDRSSASATVQSQFQNWHSFNLFAPALQTEVTFIRLLQFITKTRPADLLNVTSTIPSQHLVGSGWWFEDKDMAPLLQRKYAQWFLYQEQIVTYVVKHALKVGQDPTRAFFKNVWMKIERLVQLDPWRMSSLNYQDVFAHTFDQVKCDALVLAAPEKRRVIEAIHLGGDTASAWSLDKSRYDKSFLYMVVQRHLFAFWFRGLHRLAKYPFLHFPYYDEVPSDENGDESVLTVFRNTSSSTRPLPDTPFTWTNANYSIQDVDPEWTLRALVDELPSKPIQDKPNEYAFVPHLPPTSMSLREAVAKGKHHLHLYVSDMLILTGRGAPIRVERTHPWFQVVIGGHQMGCLILSIDLVVETRPIFAGALASFKGLYDLPLTIQKSDSFKPEFMDDDVDIYGHPAYSKPLNRAIAKGDTSVHVYWDPDKNEWTRVVLLSVPSEVPEGRDVKTYDSFLDTIETKAEVERLKAAFIFTKPGPDFAQAYWDGALAVSHTFKVAPDPVVFNMALHLPQEQGLAWSRFFQTYIAPHVTKEGPPKKAGTPAWPFPQFTRLKMRYDRHVSTMHDKEPYTLRPIHITFEKATADGFLLPNYERDNVVWTFELRREGGKEPTASPLRVFLKFVVELGVKLFKGRVPLDQSERTDWNRQAYRDQIGLMRSFLNQMDPHRQIENGSLAAFLGLDRYLPLVKTLFVSPYSFEMESFRAAFQEIKRPGDEAERPDVLQATLQGSSHLQALVTKYLKVQDAKNMLVASRYTHRPIQTGMLGTPNLYTLPKRRFLYDTRSMLYIHRLIRLGQLKTYESKDSIDPVSIVRVHDDFSTKHLNLMAADTHLGPVKLSQGADYKRWNNTVPANPCLLLEELPRPPGTQWTFTLFPSNLQFHMKELVNNFIQRQDPEMGAYVLLQDVDAILGKWVHDNKQSRLVYDSVFIHTELAKTIQAHKAPPLTPLEQRTRVDQVFDLLYPTTGVDEPALKDWYAKHLTHVQVLNMQVGAFFEQSLVEHDARPEPLEWLGIDDTEIFYTCRQRIFLEVARWMRYAIWPSLRKLQLWIEPLTPRKSEQMDLALSSPLLRGWKSDFSPLVPLVLKEDVFPRLDTVRLLLQFHDLPSLNPIALEGLVQRMDLAALPDGLKHIRILAECPTSYETEGWFRGKEWFQNPLFQEGRFVFPFPTLKRAKEGQHIHSLQLFIKGSMTSMDLFEGAKEPWGTLVKLESWFNFFCVPPAFLTSHNFILRGRVNTYQSGFMREWTHKYFSPLVEYEAQLGFKELQLHLQDTLQKSGMYGHLKLLALDQNPLVQTPLAAHLDGLLLEDVYLKNVNIDARALQHMKVESLYISTTFLPDFRYQRPDSRDNDGFFLRDCNTIKYMQCVFRLEPLILNAKLALKHRLRFPTPTADVPFPSPILIPPHLSSPSDYGVPFSYLDMRDPRIEYTPDEVIQRTYMDALARTHHIYLSNQTFPPSLKRLCLTFACQPHKSVYYKEGFQGEPFMATMTGQLPPPLEDDQIVSPSLWMDEDMLPEGLEELHVFVNGLALYVNDRHKEKSPESPLSTSIVSDVKDPTRFTLVLKDMELKMVDEKMVTLDQRFPLRRPASLTTIYCNRVQDYMSIYMPVFNPALPSDKGLYRFHLLHPKNAVPSLKYTWSEKEHAFLLSEGVQESRAPSVFPKAMAEFVADCLQDKDANDHAFRTDHVEHHFFQATAHVDPDLNK